MFEPLTTESKRAFLVYGRPGCGKTHLIGTAANGSKDKIVIFDFKGGLSTIRHLAGRGQVSVARGIRTMDQLWRTLTILDDAVRTGAVQWVCVDNLTDMGHVLMTDIRSTKMEKASGDKTIVPRGRPSLDDWGKIVYQMEHVLSKLAEFQCNVVLTAWAKFSRDHGGFATPQLETENLADVAAGMCDYVMYLKTIEDTTSVAPISAQAPAKAEHILYTKQSVEFLARDRSGVLPAAMEPDFRQIVKRLEEVGL